MAEVTGLTALAYLVVIALALVLLPYALGPIIVKFAQKQPARPQFQPVVPEAFPPDVSELFVRWRWALANAGFEVVEYMYQSPELTKVTCWLILLANRETGDMAVAADMRAATGNLNQRTTFVEFSTELVDGTEFNTNNNSMLGVFTPPRHKKVYMLPDVADPRQLFDIHRRLIKQTCPGVKSVLPTEGNEVQYFLNAVVQELASQAALGVLYLDTATNVYRPTWKGAFSMTWKLLWPVKSLRKARMRSRQKSVMKSLGFVA